MEFCNYPQIMNMLRADCCTCLKGANNQPISIRIKENDFVSGYLRIQLSLRNHVDFRHFFKLYRIEEKIYKEEKDRVTEYRINHSGEEIELNFFGLRKLKKEEAMTFLRESFHGNQNLEQIFKENSSVVLLEFFLIENGVQIGYLKHEIHVGSINKLEIKSYTPKTLCDDGEITIKLEKKIKGDTENVRLEVKDLGYEVVKKLLQPAKDVYVFKISLNKITKDHFEARLFSERNYSNYIEFKIRKSEPENFKRKSQLIEDSCSDNKISRMSFNCTNSKEVAESIDRKRQVNDNIQEKFLRKIARIGHDFAIGKETTKEMMKIISELPIVCILQDDIGDTPLNNAILKNNEDRANFLLDIVYKYFPMEINARNTSEHTALILSPACDVSLDFIKKLIDCGSDLLAVDCDGNTAMNIAIQYKKTEVLYLLLNEANLKNVFLTNQQLNFLLKDVLNNDYFDGFELIANHYPIILEDLNDCEFDVNQLELHRSFVENFRYFSENNEEYITPLAENTSDDILDFLLSE